MSEENKYYTPKIEEFHVGFEFQNYVPDMGSFDEGYVSREFSLDYSVFIKNVYELNRHNGCFRVKFLDKEDIEGEGWGNCQAPTIILHEGNITEYDSIWTFDKYTLHAWMNSPDAPTRFIRISVKISKKSQIIIFNGVIKNKSELKKIMEMLQVK